MIIRVLKLVISLIFHVAKDFWPIKHILFAENCLPTLVILTYHSVKKEKIEKFSRQMDTILRVGHPISLCDVLPDQTGNYIAVTFDDGFQSVIHNALPILREKNIPAAIFVPTGSLGKHPEWIIDANHLNANEFILTEAQLRSLPSNLIIIGSHTVSHIKLFNIDKDTMRREINESKKQLQKIINREIKYISVPYATFDKTFTPLFKEAGYERVFLNIPTFPATKTDLYVLGRIKADLDDWPIETRLKLLGDYQWVSCAIEIKNSLLKHQVNKSN